MIDYKGSKIYITRFVPESENLPGGIPANIPSEPLNEASNFPSRDSEVPDENSPWNDSIRVSNIDKTLTEQTLVMLFENEKRHGGGEITTVDYKEGSGEAIISFKDPDGNYGRITLQSLSH